MPLAEEEKKLTEINHQKAINRRTKLTVDIVIHDHSQLILQRFMEFQQNHEHIKP